MTMQPHASLRGTPPPHHTPPPAENAVERIRDEALIEHLIHESSVIRDEAEQIRRHANAIVRRLEESRRDIGIRAEEHRV